MSLDCRPVSPGARAALQAVHNSPQKPSHTARKIEKARENKSPPTLPPAGTTNRKRRRFSLSIKIDRPNTESDAVPSNTTASDTAVKAKRVFFALGPNVPHAPSFQTLQPMSRMKGIKSGQGALYGLTTDGQAFKCKVFDAAKEEGCERHPKLAGFTKALLTALICPETVLPTQLAAQKDGSLITMQPMQLGAIDVYRAHKAWLDTPGNNGTVIDYLNTLFKAQPELEEAFIIASLSEIILGSTDSKAVNMLLDNASGKFFLCDTDISLCNVSFVAEGVLAFETGKPYTYLCETTDHKGQRLAFMDMPFKDVLAKWPKVRTFLAQPNRSRNAINAFMQNNAHRDLVALYGNREVVDAGYHLVHTRLHQLNQLAKSDGTLSKLLLSD